DRSRSYHLLQRTPSPFRRAPLPPGARHRRDRRRARLQCGDAPMTAGNLCISAIVVFKFDYDALAPEIAAMVQKTAAAIRQGHQRQVDEVIAAGLALIEVKKALPHGDFGKWIEAEFGWSERTALNYVRVAETY